MPLIIAHGQPKSGSTFLFQAAVALRDRVDGTELYAVLRRLLGQNASVFYDHIPLERVQTILEAAGPETLIIKTHGPLPDDVRPLLEQGLVKAFTSFRDPRDACRSMLDAGASDRAKGSTRWFASKTRVEDLTGPIAHQYRSLQTWLDCPQVLAIPYYITANHQDAAVRLLCRHLGYGALGRLIAAQMQERRSSVPEFYKGISDRFLSDFSAEEIAFLNGALAPQIAAYERHAAERMARLGHRMLHTHLVALRNAHLDRLSLAVGA
ncbi:hypothetical protein [Rubellimicrobium sp. CFH 75288]|uniref:hypothetical protein n=1 Tax=Rubellimicrobium sp. CFH 75288 TaxID=2697034 RepID=UPI001412CC2E|nr:hypothetical protein [Rubellimicrobium sp. CFH 75288]NAZ38125.1 hypothetical protein [Rubellimicrobium sp. CFH 75288]